MTNVFRSISGFCPTQNAPYTIEVEFLDNSSVVDSEPRYIKGMFTCNHIAYGENACPCEKSCPIYESAPC